MFRWAPAAFKPESISQLRDLSLERPAYFFKIHLFVGQLGSRFHIAALFGKGRFSIEVKNAGTDGHTSQGKDTIFSLVQYFVYGVAREASRRCTKQLLCFVQ